MLKSLLKTMRPKQWSKNVFVFAALVFDQKLFHVDLLAKTLVGFIIFCFISSAVYIINDVIDIEKDRQHPIKRHRPLASGQLKPTTAIVAAVIISLICLPLAFLLSTGFGLITLTYLLLITAYSFRLKNVVLLDVLTIAAGFVLRVAAGTLIFPVERFSPWLYVCTTLVALFLALSKRRHELITLAGNANEHRRSLNDYSLHLLDELIAVVTSTTVIAYSLYTFLAPNVPPNHTMMLTIPFVLYGIFRYLYLIHMHNQGGAPEEIVLRDKPFLINMALWGLAVLTFMYLI